MLKSNRILQNILISISPFIIMIVINEFERPKIDNRFYNYHGANTINPSGFNTQKCTWACHNNTVSHCKKYHGKLLKPFYNITDKPYSKVINALRISGNYDLANIVFLVLLVPSSIVFFFIKALNLQDEINKLKRQK